MSIELVAWVVDNVRLDLIGRPFLASSNKHGLLWLESVSQWVGATELCRLPRGEVMCVDEVLPCAAKSLSCGPIGGLVRLRCWVAVWSMLVPTAAKQAKDSLACQ
eukprot:5617228-Amphidinium_carterae.1